jgi:CRISPR/Cas system-associated exonuclease Cas4 (RecB family)
VNCSLSFYLKYFSNVKAEEDRTDDVEADRFGRICHKALEWFYEPHIGKVLKPADIEEMLVKIDPVLERAFFDEMKVDSIETGKHVLVFETLKNMLVRFLNSELESIVKDSVEGVYTSIVALERKLDKVVTIPLEEEELSVQLSGYADRIDIRNQVTRILDYKTGGGDTSDLSYGNIEELFTLPKREKAMQLFYYHLLFAEHNTQKDLQSGIVWLKKTSKGAVMVQNLESNHNEQIEQGFLGLISRIFDANEAFEQTEDIERCKYCPYKGVCSRN